MYKLKTILKMFALAINYTHIQKKLLYVGVKMTFVPNDLPYSVQTSARSLLYELSSSIYPRVDVYPLVHSGQKDTMKKSVFTGLAAMVRTDGTFNKTKKI